MQDVIFFKTQDAFYDWLENNTQEKELWVGYLKKNTKENKGQASITWSESVDVALCFGWIDGIRKTIDDQRYKIRFTPRQMKSVWSKVNVEKVNALIPLGKMKPAGLHLFNNRSDKEGYTSHDRNIPLTQTYEAQVKANAPAWSFLNNLAPSYKRDSIWWVMSAKREETQLKRLAILIESCEQGLKIPMFRKK
jgi:uncharacterized protein YdeI (YjbR/CyaY-like superfamily)